MPLILVLAAIPLIGLVGDLGYEQSKVIFLIFSLSLISLWWLKNKEQFRLSKIKIAATIFLVSLIIASIFGANPYQSLIGEEPYYQGLIAYFFLWWLFLLVSASKISLINLSKALTISAVLVAFLALKDWLFLSLFNIDVPTYAGRVVSSFGQPNFYAGYLLLVLPFTWFSKKGYLRNLGLLSILTGVLISQSKTALVILVMLIFIWLAEKLTFKKIVYIFSGLFISLAVFLSVFVTQVGPAWKEAGLPLQNEWLFHNAPEKRILVWKVLFDQSLKRPVFGYGIDNLNLAYSSFDAGEPPWPAWFSLKNLYIDRSHNYLLDLYFFGGIFSLGSFLWLIYLLLKQTKGALLISLLIFLVWMQVQNLSIIHLMFFWLIAGLIDREREKTFT